MFSQGNKWPKSMVQSDNKNIINYQCKSGEDTKPHTLGESCNMLKNKPRLL